MTGDYYNAIKRSETRDDSFENITDDIRLDVVPFDDVSSVSKYEHANKWIAFIFAALHNLLY